MHGICHQDHATTCCRTSSVLGPPTALKCPSELPLRCIGALCCHCTPNLDAELLWERPGVPQTNVRHGCGAGSGDPLLSYPYNDGTFVTEP
jgi:hypothetical protein